MAQVPYSPVPDVQPEDRVAYAPQLNIRTDPNMFGANIGRAVEGLGGTLSKVGDELFDRALAIQEVKNQSELDDHYTELLQRTAPIHANFSALQGKNAADGLQQYGVDLENIRSDIQSKASNPRVARLFESTSRNQIARDMFNGAGHAGEQLKVYQRDAVRGNIDAEAHAAGLNPFDDQGFNDRVARVADKVKDESALMGLDPEDAVRKETSRLWKERLISMGRTDPFKATKLLHDNNDKIRSDDYANIDKVLQYQRNTTGARNISSGILNGRNLILGQDKVPIELAKKAIGGFESGDRYDLTGPPTHLGRALGRYQVMEAELPSQLKEAGLPPMTSQQFLHNPDAQDQLFSTVFGNLMEKYGSFNEAASRWFSGRSVASGIASGVKDAFHTTVPKYLANVNAILAKNVPLSKLVDAGTRTASSLSDDPLLPDYTTQHITTDHNRIKAVERDNLQQARDTIDDAIMGNFSNGQIPSNPEELRALPQVQQVIDSGKLTQKELLDLPGKLNRYRSSVAQKTDDAVMNKLKGLADEEPLEFMAIKDFTQFPLSQRSIGQLQKLQRQKRADAEGNPDLAKAYSYIRPQLPSDFDDASNKETRLQFKGALQAAIESEMQEQGRKLKPQEYIDIGKNLLKQTVTGPGWIQTITGGRLGSPNLSGQWFQQKVPDKAAQAIKQDWMDRDQGVPSDEQIRDEYIREIWTRDFGKKKE